jgi:hypothetical protein
LSYQQPNPHSLDHTFIPTSFNAPDIDLDRPAIERNDVCQSYPKFAFNTRAESAIYPKLLEMGWSTGDTDASALAEYIILMLVNGKTQNEIASEISSQPLHLSKNDPGATDFSPWLFQQVEVLLETKYSWQFSGFYVTCK